MGQGTARQGMRPGYTRRMRDPGRRGAKERFLDFLTRKHLRLTAQRRAILESAFSTQRHFTAEELLTWAHRRDPSVSRATVYRTLPLLTESGLVREMDFGQDRKFYDPNYAEHPGHSHLICEDCQRIIEFESPQIEQLGEEMGRKLGFTVTAQRLQITAHCDEFQRSGTCQRKLE